MMVEKSPKKRIQTRAFQRKALQASEIHTLSRMQKKVNTSSRNTIHQMARTQMQVTRAALERKAFDVIC